MLNSRILVNNTDPQSELAWLNLLAFNLNLGFQVDQGDIRKRM